MADVSDPDFERERVAYEQNFQHVRALIPVMYQMPALAITITGGLWYGVLQTRALPVFGYLFLLLAFMMNIGFCLIMRRLDGIISLYLDKLGRFYPATYVNAKHNVATAGHAGTSKWPYANTVFEGFFVVAAVCSAIGIFLLWWYPAIL